MQIGSNCLPAVLQIPFILTHWDSNVIPFSANCDIASYTSCPQSGKRFMRWVITTTYFGWKHCEHPVPLKHWCEQEDHVCLMKTIFLRLHKNLTRSARRAAGDPAKFPSSSVPSPKAGGVRGRGRGRRRSIGIWTPYKMRQGPLSCSRQTQTCIQHTSVPRCSW